MLNKGLRDEESIRIENTLRTLHSLVYVPKFWNIDDTALLDNQLTNFGLTLENLVNCDKNYLITLLVRCHLDWDQLEQFADFLMTFSKSEPYQFEEKGLAIYQYIQQESKVFSFGINAKIALIQK